MLLATFNAKPLKTAILVLAAVSILAFFFLGILKQSQKSAEKPVTNSAERIAFLEKFGIDVVAESEIFDNVTIPTKFNETYTNYNNIQLKNGFDLLKFKGKTVERYSYAVKNFDGGVENVRVTVLIYNSTVIGGDVSLCEQGGFLLGLGR